jgi:endonuclease/exonuclease/phosphatase family metal-dependent hydrolase
MPLSLLARLLGKPSSRRTNSRVKFTPHLEVLEGRLVPATLKFMTYNVNEGTDHVHVLTALQQGSDLPTAVGQDYGDVVASDIPDRALGIANVIEQSHADVIGVQEATVYSVNGKVTYDILGSIMNDLNAHGQHYKLVQTAPALNIQLPDASGDLIGEADQNAIIMHVGCGDDAIQVSNAQAGTFAAHATIAIGTFSLPVNRSWASADFTVHGHTIHFVTAHLESLSDQLAALQAQELVAGPASSSLPTVVGADFNSPADGTGAAYNVFANPSSGFIDAWKARHPDSPGYTWGEQPDSHSPAVILTERIDFTFVHGAQVLSSQEPGFHRRDRAPGHVWPSDHAAVVSVVKF